MTTRLQGRLVQWDDAKGYGFIEPDGPGGRRIFVHARAFGLRPRRPFVGERLSYLPGEDAQGKPRALKVQSLEPRPAPAGPPPKSASRGAASRSATGGQRGQGGAPGHASVWLVPAFALLVAITHLAWPLPRAVWAFYMAMSMATFIIYALDKRAARLGQWRVAEGTLHGLALACGWPGALLAQQVLRHKSAKASFRRIFWLSVMLNILGFVLLFTPLISHWRPF